MTKDLIYISNTKIPSKKANTYQSFCVCEALVKKLSTVEFWHPARQGDYQDQTGIPGRSLEAVFECYGILPIFKLKKFYCLDMPWLARINQRTWFLLQAFSFAFSCIVALRKQPLDKVVFIRDSITLSVLGLGKKFGLIKHKIFFEAHIYSVREDRHSRLIDGVVVINHYLKTLYASDSSRDVLVAHDAVRGDELSDLADNHIHQTSNSQKVVLYSGNLFAWKGVYTLVDSTIFLPDHCKIVFLGGSPDTLHQFIKYVNNNPKIEIFGFKPKTAVRKYLQSADVLVLPNSSKDAWSSYTSPLKLFEYMAARKPIVASRLSSLQEVLRDGENAVLFNPDDPKDLAEKIQWVLDNDCTHLVEQAWRDVQEYTWDKRAEKIINWMTKLGAWEKSGDTDCDTC